VDRGPVPSKRLGYEELGLSLSLHFLELAQKGPSKTMLFFFSFSSIGSGK